MISVIREWAEFINAMKGLIDDFVELLIKAFQVAKESLADTTRQLEVLAKSNVVDAGAKGFVLFLEGMIDFFKNRQTIRRLAIPMNDMTLDEVTTDSHEEITFRYCCEAMLALDLHPGETKNTLRDAIADMGDSMVVAGSEKRLRIHIHSDNPIKLFEAISKRSSITYQKVDDMIMQQEMSHNRKWPVALVTDSTCDLPQEILEEYQISMVPLTLQVGASLFLDRTTIASEQFYNLLDTSPVYPTTSQPAYKDFINKYSYLSSHYESIIGIQLSKHFSGTFSNSQRAAKAVSEQSGKNISVLSSKRVSSALGLVVLRAAKAIESGKTHDEVVAGIEEWTTKSHLLVSTRTIKYLVKGGRVSHSKGIVGKLLGVKPIISIDDEGKVITFGKAFSENGSKELLIKEASRLIAKGKIWGYAISHVRNMETALWYETQMEALTGKKPLFINDCSPVLGVHGGPGTVVLSIMEE
jgi:DegV family protein with EDD domain